MVPCRQVDEKPVEGYRDDPVYKKNVQDRIERSRMFEEPSE
jgi:hypothetical protein